MPMEEQDQDQGRAPARSTGSELADEARRLSRTRTSSVRELAASFETRFARAESLNPLDSGNFKRNHAVRKEDGGAASSADDESDQEHVQKLSADKSTEESEPGPIAVSIPITQMAADKNGSMFIKYCIQFRQDGGVWMLRHRFRDFVQLDAELRRMFRSRDPAMLERMPTLPEKKWFGNLEDNFVASRREKLEVYLITLVPLIQTDIAAIIIFEAWIGPAQKFVQAGSKAVDTAASKAGASSTKLRDKIDLRGSKFPLPGPPARTSAEADEFAEDREEDSGEEEEWSNAADASGAVDDGEFGQNAKFAGVDIVSSIVVTTRGSLNARNSSVNYRARKVVGPGGRVIRRETQSDVGIFGRHKATSRLSLSAGGANDFGPGSDSVSASTSGSEAVAGVAGAAGALAEAESAKAVAAARQQGQRSNISFGNGKPLHHASTVSFASMRSRFSQANAGGRQKASASFSAGMKHAQRDISFTRKASLVLSDAQDKAMELLGLKSDGKQAKVERAKALVKAKKLAKQKQRRERANTNVIHKTWKVVASGAEKPCDPMKIQHQGYLTKRGGFKGGFLSRVSWRRRFIVIKGGCLHYYRTTRPTLLGVLPLLGGGRVVKIQVVFDNEEDGVEENALHLKEAGEGMSSSGVGSSNAKTSASHVSLEQSCVEIERMTMRMALERLSISAPGDMTFDDSKSAIALRCAFYVVTEDRTLYLYADSVDEREAWVRTIDRVFRSFKAKELQAENGLKSQRKKSSSRRRRSKRGTSDGSEKQTATEQESRTLQEELEGKKRDSKSLTEKEEEASATDEVLRKRQEGAGGEAKAEAEAAAEEEEEEEELEDDDKLAPKQQELGWEWEIDQNEIEVMEAIGSGAFGAVYRGRLWGSDVAVKTLHAAQQTEDNTPIIDSLKEESELLARLRHPNVVLYIGACTKLPNICIVTEWCARGSLYDLLHEETVPISCYLMSKMALQAAQGMCYLHAQDLGIIHRDLKSHNLLVGDSFEVKVADFGLTVVRNKVADTISSTASVAKNGEGTEAEDKEEGAFYGIRGTPQWMAPEVMEGQRYNEKVDVYSFGIVLTEIFTRQMPFADSYKGFDFVDAVLEEGRIPTLPMWLRKKGESRSNDSLDDTSAGFSAKLRALIFSCLDRDPRARPAFDLIVEHLRYAVSLSDALFADVDDDTDECEIAINGNCLGGFAADVERIASGLEIGFLWSEEKGEDSEGHSVQTQEKHTHDPKAAPSTLETLRSHALKMSIESSLGPSAVQSLATAGREAAKNAAIGLRSQTSSTSQIDTKSLPRWKQIKLEKEKRLREAAATAATQQSTKRLNALVTQKSSAVPIGRNRALISQVNGSQLAWLELRHKVGGIVSAQFCPLSAARELHGIATTVFQAMVEHRRDGSEDVAGVTEKMQKHYKYTFAIYDTENNNDDGSKKSEDDDGGSVATEGDSGFRLSRATDLQNGLLQSLPLLFDRIGTLLTVAVTGQAPWSLGKTVKPVALVDLWRVARLRRHGHQWAQTVFSSEGGLAGGLGSIHIAKECVKTLLALLRATELEGKLAARSKITERTAGQSMPPLMRVSSGDSVSSSSSRRSLRKSQRIVSGRQLSVRTLSSRFSSRGSSRNILQESSDGSAGDHQSLKRPLSMSLSKAEQKSYASMRARFGGDAVGLSVSITSPGSLRGTSSSELQQLEPVEEERIDVTAHEDCRSDEDHGNESAITISVRGNVSGGDSSTNADHDEQVSNAPGSVAVNMLLRHKVVTSLVMLLGCRTLGGEDMDDGDKDGPKKTDLSFDKLNLSQLENAALSGAVLAEVAELIATLLRLDRRLEEQARHAFTLVQESALKEGSAYTCRVASRVGSWLPQLGLGKAGGGGDSDGGEKKQKESHLRREVAALELSLRNARAALAALE